MSISRGYLYTYICIHIYTYVYTYLYHTCSLKDRSSYVCFYSLLIEVFQHRKERE